jgi:hypothetical protein
LLVMKRVAQSGEQITHSCTSVTSTTTMTGSARGVKG